MPELQTSRTTRNEAQASPVKTIPWPSFGTPTETRVAAEGVQFTIPRGETGYLSARREGSAQTLHATYLPPSYESAKVHDAGVVKRVGFDRQGGEVLKFTPDPEFRGEFLVSTSRDGRSGQSTRYTVGSTPSLSLPPPTRTPVGGGVGGGGGGFGGFGGDAPCVT